MQKQLVKNFEEACAVLKMSVREPEGSWWMPVELNKSVVAYYKLLVIAKVLNDGWEPDFNNNGQAKYFPWFYKTNDKFSFMGFVYDLNGANALVSSKLCYKTEALAKYAATQFIDLYRDYLK